MAIHAEDPRLDDSLREVEDRVKLERSAAGCTPVLAEPGPGAR